MRSFFINLNILFFLLVNIYQAECAAITWTGSVNKSWSVAGNWSTGTVPTINDEVFIFGPIVYDVKVDGDFSCRRLSIGSNVLNVNILDGYTLTIDGQNVATTDLLFIASSSSMENYGSLVVTNLATSQENELIDIEGVFKNVENATLLLEYHTFSGTNSGEKNREAINVGNNGELINEGTITMNYLDGSGIIVNGTLNNKNTGIINLNDKIDFAGILLVDGTTTPSFYNYGQVISAMNDLSSSVTLRSYQDTEIFNYGLINISNSTNPIHSISLRGDITNYSSGEIEILNSKGIQYGFPNSGVMEFLNEGTVSINYPGSNIGTAFNIRNGATVNNKNEIAISGFVVGMGTTSAGNFLNQENGVVSISGATIGGFNNVGEINNFGEISIEDCGNESFRNLYTTVNHPSGIINIINADGWAVRNARASNSSPHANFQNYGKLNISALNNDLAIYNFDQSIFRQSGKINILSASKIINLSPAIFMMKDTINAAEFDNRGVLEFLPSSSPYVFNGKLTLGGTSTVEYYLTSSFNIRKIKVEGDLQVDGILDLNFESGFVPGAFQSIDLIEQTGNRLGFFENFMPEFALNNHDLNYSNEQKVKLAYNPCGNVPVVNEFLYTSGNWSSASNWSLGHIPFPCEEVVIQSPGIDPTTVNMNSSSVEIAKLTLFANAELIIQSGKTLKINREFRENLGQEAILINANGKLTNHGTLLVHNVDGGSFIKNYGEIFNDDILFVKHGYNSGIIGMRNFGVYRNSDDGLLVVSNLDAGPADTPIGVFNSGSFVENGDSDLTHGFYNHVDGYLYGNGSLLSSVDNFGTINPGEDAVNSVGDLTINGNLEMNADSKLQVDVYGLDGPGELNGHDRLTVSMATNLDGEIDMVLEPSFVPNPSDQFAFLYYQSNLNGDFNSESLPVGLTNWKIVDNNNDKLILMFHETCLILDISWTGLGNGFDWSDGSNWNKDFIPQACHNVYIGPSSNVSILNNDIANASYLKLKNAHLSIKFGTQLTLHGAQPIDATFKIVKSSVINKGELIIKKAETNISLDLGTLSSLVNTNSIIIK